MLDPENFALIRFLHHALTIGKDGTKLSKSAGADPLQAMRRAGTGPQKLIDEAERFVEDFFSPSGS